MAKLVVMDELHLTCWVPHILPKRQEQDINRTLTSRRLEGELLRAIRAVFRRYPVLQRVRVQLTR